MDYLGDAFRNMAASGFAIVIIAFYVLYVIALWRVFTKAGFPGILALIPIVNVFCYVMIAGYSAWMTLLFLIPLVNLIFAIVVSVRVGRGFGKDPIWSFFLLFVFQIVGAFILGYGRARYRRPA